MTERRLFLLDCTLRDGGYQNDWRFGEEAVSQVLAHLSAAEIDFVECGFLRREAYCPGRTIFEDPRVLSGLLPQGSATRFVAMAEWGRQDLAALPDAKECGLYGLRLSFDRHNAQEALRDAGRLREKGYAVSLQPVRLTTNYSPAQVGALLREVNALGNCALYLVDTLGVLYPPQAVEWYRRICSGLAPDIAVGYHAHDHRHLALAGALSVAAEAESCGRTLVLDGCLGGLGKAAGNAPTEHLLYALRPRQTRQFTEVLAAVDALGLGFSAKTAYFLASVRRCNTGYADWLMAQGVDTALAMWDSLGKLPQESRPFFDAEAAQKIGPMG